MSYTLRLRSAHLPVLFRDPLGQHTFCSQMRIEKLVCGAIGCHRSFEWMIIEICSRLFLVCQLGECGASGRSLV